MSKFLEEGSDRPKNLPYTIRQSHSPFSFWCLFAYGVNQSRSGNRLHLLSSKTSSLCLSRDSGPANKVEVVETVSFSTDRLKRLPCLPLFPIWAIDEGDLRSEFNLSDIRTVVEWRTANYRLGFSECFVH